ncbi:hypothetical protein LHGZ1_0110 [Laribacter hongkongensis]|uniref:Uncharacterized protein n=1 Tax=Laribacter hongkongensis TaxID=168471 RepID=A0A248LEJ3_9NEIS|nr:hypothetical protein LHGZ1_0110 [Laribacter hongkongensis]
MKFRVASGVPCLRQNSLSVRTAAGRLAGGPSWWLVWQVVPAAWRAVARTVAMRLCRAHQKYRAGRHDSGTAMLQCGRPACGQGKTAW